MGEGGGLLKLTVIEKCQNLHKLPEFRDQFLHISDGIVLIYKGRTLIEKSTMIEMATMKGRLMFQLWLPSRYRGVGAESIICALDMSVEVKQDVSRLEG